MSNIYHRKLDIVYSQTIWENSLILFLTLFSKSGFICRRKGWWLRSDMAFIFTSEKTNKSSMTLPQVSSEVCSQVKINDIRDLRQHILHEMSNKSHSQHSWIWWRWLNLCCILNPPSKEKEIKFASWTKLPLKQHSSLLPCYHADLLCRSSRSHVVVKIN